MFSFDDNPFGNENPDEQDSQHSTHSLLLTEDRLQGK